MVVQFILGWVVDVVVAVYHLDLRYLGARLLEVLFSANRARRATSGKKSPLAMEDLLQEPALLGLNCHCGPAVAGGLVPAWAGHVVEDPLGKIDVVDLGGGGEGERLFSDCHGGESPEVCRAPSLSGCLRSISSCRRRC